MRSWTIALGMLMICNGNPIHATAQDTAPAVEPKSNLESQNETASTTVGWSMQCRAAAETEIDCEINNAIYSNQNQQRFMGLTLRRAVDAKQEPVVRMAVALPHGVNLETGLTVAFDKGTPTLLTPTTSDASGLFASTILVDEQLQVLKKAKSVSFTFSGFDQKKYVVSFETTGLAKLMTAALLLPKE